MDNFTPISALAGGVLIGLSAGILWLVNGRIAGISGILGGLFPTRSNETGWRVLYLGALVVGATIGHFLLPDAMSGLSDDPPLFDTGFATLVVAGLLVGVGTRLGGGCTSGHGVCGLSRLSVRSFAAVVVFMLVGAITVFLARHVL